MNVTLDKYLLRNSEIRKYKSISPEINTELKEMISLLDYVKNELIITFNSKQETKLNKIIPVEMYINDVLYRSTIPLEYCDIKYIDCKYGYVCKNINTCVYFHPYYHYVNEKIEQRKMPFISRSIDIQKLFNISPAFQKQYFDLNKEKLVPQLQQFKAIILDFVIRLKCLKNIDIDIDSI